MVKTLIFFTFVNGFASLVFAQNLPRPENDGWASEFLTNQIQEQFYKIIAKTKAGHSLDGLLSDNSNALNFNPAHLIGVRDDHQVVVKRLSDDGTVAKKQASLAETLAVILDGRNNASEFTPKVKISRINIKGEKVLARILLFASTNKTKSTDQLNVVINTEWILEGELPVLDSIDLVGYETVTLKSDKPWFRDATAAIFNQDSIFRHQIAVGMNEWLNRIERFAGSNIYSRHGMAMGDANGDGLDDLYVCQPGGLPNRLFLAQEDGTLKDASSEFGVDWLNDTRSALFVDFDNDGDQDLVLGTFIGVYVCRNNKGRFEIATRLKGVGRDVSSIVAADYDDDGFVDIYVCVYESKARLEGSDRTGLSVYDSGAKGGVNKLFRNSIASNKTEWSFEDVTGSTGLDKGNQRFSLAAAWEDFDNDGDQDLYVANDFGLNCLYENRNGNFVEVSKELNVQDYGPGMSATWGDVNRDGTFDLYVGNMFSSAGNRITRQEQFKASFEGVTRAKLNRFNRGNSLYLNLDAGFVEKPDALGAQNALWAWSSLLGDIDNDGWEDVLCANGYITGSGSGDL